MNPHFFTAPLFLNLLTLRSLLCHLSLIHRGQCILQNLKKVYMNSSHAFNNLFLLEVLEI